MNRLTKALTATAAVALTAIPAAAALAAPVESAGPLTLVEITPDLNCAVQYDGDERQSFFGDTACGTFLSSGDSMFSPASIPAGSGVTSGSTAWEPVSQQVTGSGTAADPYTITTVVKGGDFEVTQVDTYVTGDNAYRTTTTVTNTGSAQADGVLFHAGDCYLQDDDLGFGEYDEATGAITCRAKGEGDTPTSDSRIEQFVPLTAGSNYFYDSYYDVWSKVAEKAPLPNEVVEPDYYRDNGMALSWNVSLAPGASQSFSMLTNFSPIGVVSLPTEITLDPTTAAVGQEVTVNVNVTNPNIGEQIADLNVALPEGVTFVADSTDGVGAPTVSSNTLTFDDNTLAANQGELSFTFKVTVDAPLTDAAFNVTGSTESGAPVIESSATLSAEGEFAPTPTPTETPTPTPTATPSETAVPVDPTTPAEPTPSADATVVPVVDEAEDGSKLPSTGGEGLELLVGTAAVLALAGAGTLVVRRRDA